MKPSIHWSLLSSIDKRITWQSNRGKNVVFGGTPFQTEARTEYLCVYGGKKQKYSPKKNAAYPAEVRSQIIQNKILCSFSNFKCDCLVLLKVT